MLAVQLPVEQDQAVDDVEGNDEGLMLLRENTLAYL